MFNSLPDNKSLDWSKLKQTANDILECIWNEKYVPYRVENIVRKGEISYSKQFLFFSQCFPQLYTVKPVLETTCIKGPSAVRDHCSDTATLLKSTW